MLQTSPSVIVNNYGYFYPYRGFYAQHSANKPLRTEVVDRPDDYLVSLDEARSWVGLSGDIDSDNELQALLESFSDYVCGPNSLTNKCFRKWKLTDTFEIWRIHRRSRIYLSYPIVQGIESIYYDLLGNRSEIDSSKYRLVKRNLRKSYIEFLEDIDIVNDNDFSAELGIIYNASANLDVNTPIIDKKINLAVKHYINDSFYKRGIHFGPFEGAGVQNKIILNLLRSFMY